MCFSKFTFQTNIFTFGNKPRGNVPVMLTTTVMTMLRAKTLREVTLAHVTQAILEMATTVLIRNTRHVCTLSPYIVEVILAVVFVIFLFLPDFFFFFACSISGSSSTSTTTTTTTTTTGKSCSGSTSNSSKTYINYELISDISKLNNRSK